MLARMSAAGTGVQVEKLARAVVVAASVWFAFTAAWGMFGTASAGHLGAGSAGNFMAAEQILRWKIVYPAWDWYSGAPPPKAQYICHHPFGQYWIAALFLWVFGHRDFVLHLPAVLMSAAIPPLLYGIAKERWGAGVGAVAAAGYTVVPLAVGFSGFWNVETICIFGTLLFFWGHSRHTTTGKRRFAAASVTGLVVACAGDWAGYLLVVPALVWSLLRAFVLPPRLTPRFRRAPYIRWWALSVAAAAATLLLWLALFYRAGQIGDWVASGEHRGGESPLAQALVARHNWIDFAFTPLAILIGKIAVPVSLLRLIVLRRDEESYAPSLLFGATVQYLAFPHGADIHIYWPLYFVPYYALALAQLAHTAAWLVGRPWLREAPDPRRAALAGLALGMLPVLGMARDGVASLWVWRRTGGRYDENGKLIRDQLDALEVVKQVVVPRAPRGTRIDAHPAFKWGWEFLWAFQGQADSAATPQLGSATTAHPFWIARASALSSDAQKKIAAAAHVRVWGDVWLVDQREAQAPLDAFAVEEREPGALEWLVQGGVEPVRRMSATPDPWLTWEWRTHLGQDAPPPTGEPVGIDAMRAAHNAAIERGDVMGAEALRERIEAQLERSVAARFDGGVRLIGVRVTSGVQPRIESWFECTAPLPDAFFHVKATMEARAPLSLVPIDTTEREVAWQPTLPTGIWRPGFLYKTEAVADHLVGRERYWGYWMPIESASAPRRPDGRLQTNLAVLP
jgi:4-amino-4-deoxy-L-arabinose transferase-like glycosyltransferase